MAWRCIHPAKPSAPRNCASAPTPSCCARPRKRDGPARRGRCAIRRRRRQRTGEPRRSTRCWSAVAVCQSPRRRRAVGIMRRMQSAYRPGERVRARHILFAVTPGVDVAAAPAGRAHCSTCAALTASGRAFRRWPPQLSNCPSGAHGGELGLADSGRLRAGVRARVVRHIEVGVLPRLVHSRFGLHVVEVLGREPGVAQSVRGGPRRRGDGAAPAGLRHRPAPVPALLAGQAVVEGVELDAADTPLVQ